MKPPRLYFDNAATTHPKPPEVLQAMIDYTRIGGSAGRGAYAEALESATVIRNCRQSLNRLFNGENPNHFIFTLNCTDALNLAIKGLLRGPNRPTSPHLLTTAMDHNSVLRPFHAMAEEIGAACTHVPVDPASGIVDPTDIKKAIRPETRLIAVTHASNVTGAIQPIRQIGRIAREAGIPFLVDVAQTAGHVPIDVRADQIDLLAMPGHKGLLGPLGTGALYIRPGVEKILAPLRHGGTGSASERPIQPDIMPDKYESGSHNAIGIAGLGAAADWLLKRTVHAIQEHDRRLSEAFITALTETDGLEFFGPSRADQRVGVFSIRVEGIDPHRLADRLEKDFGILTRAGFHCAPLAHRTLQTLPTGGTTRFSFGPFLTLQDIQFAAGALRTIAQEHLAAVK